MKRVTLITTALVFAVVAVLATRALAQETNVQERSFITFSNTVEMPGVTLPAGTYVFRLADTPQRNVVQVLSQDENKVLGQWLFVQHERPEVTGDTVIMFKENAENTKPAVQYWYFPGEKIGKEFVYPKDQAEKIAERTGQKVRTNEGYVTPGNTNASNAQPSSTVASSENNSSNASHRAAQASASASAQASNTEHNAPASAQPSAAAGSLAGNRGVESQGSQASLNQEPNNNRAVGTTGVNNQASTSSANTNANTTRRARRLPKTGSDLPLAGVIGLLSLAGAFGIRRFGTVYNE
jgi:LPXTG-motif cell wall-anchored protein